MGSVPLNELFYYDESSPTCLRWKLSRYTGRNHSVLRIAAGESAGTLCGRDGNVYYKTSPNRKSVMVHIIIWQLFNGDVPLGFVVDHIDGDNLNNRIANLRLISQTQNMRNCRMSAANKTGVTGVQYRADKECYVATWYALDGRLRQKSYSISKWGEAALNKAIMYRDLMIEQLNSQGAGYTERHGQRGQENSQG